jgi:hypothetical protein
MSVAVVYLSYVPMGTRYLNSFLNLYKQQESIISHRLFIVFNGYKNKQDIIPFLDIIKKLKIEASILYTRSKFDISAYFFFAKKNSAEYLLFFNTYSQPLHHNWLSYYINAIQQPDIGAVGATGSWGNKFRDNQYRTFLKMRMLSLFSIKEIIKYRFNYYPTIQPHLRTNAFMVKRADFMNIKYHLFRPFIFNLLHLFKESKLTTECFEHGINGFTRQLVKKNLRVVVIDKFGRIYDTAQWKDSNTFWNSNQENLLVADNQTLKYTNGSLIDRKNLHYLAFGEELKIAE